MSFPASTPLQTLLDAGTDELKRAESIQLRLEGQLQEKESQFLGLQKEVGEAKTREAWQPEVKKVLEALQRSEHERAVGTFEKLLTALLNDILPGDRQVLLDLSTSAGLAALDVSLLKDLHIPQDFASLSADARQDLDVEDALHGAGGAVANVLSMGLRMITLIRSGQRRFLVLDEADCWIKPTLVGAFAKVVQQAAMELGIQVLMISHHDESHFADIPHRLYLRKTESGLKADWSVEGGKPIWDAEQAGFRSLALFGFQAHESTYLPLSPGVTLLYGENDVGKSSVVTALRAVFYGETSDALIRHQEPSAKVIVEMEQDKVLVWERHRKQSKDKNKGLYTLKQVGLSAPLHESPKAKGVPDWLLSETGVGMVDDLDVQLGSQKDPVFLLNRPASQRAKALAVGSDSGFVQIMMDMSKDELSEAKSTIKRGEKQLEILHREIHARQGIREVNLKPLAEDRQTLGTRLERAGQLRVLLEKWTQATLAEHALEGLAEMVWPKEPTLRTPYAYQSLLERWSKASRTVQALTDIEQVHLSTMTTPRLQSQAQPWLVLQTWEKAFNTLKTLQGIENVHLTDIAVPTLQSQHQTHTRALLQRWEKAEKTLDILHRVPDCSMSLPNPVLQVEKRQALMHLLQKWELGMGQKTQLADLVQADEGALEKAQRALEALYPETCPTCQQPWPHQHSNQDHASPLRAHGKTES